MKQNNPSAHAYRQQQLWAKLCQHICGIKTAFSSIMKSQSRNFSFRQKLINHSYYLLLLSLLWMGFKSSVQAQSWPEIAKITANDGAAGDNFGHSVSIDGNYTIVGALADDDNDEDFGSAYIFYKNEDGADNWGQITKITTSDGARKDWFGNSVSINGDYVIVGARGDDDNGDRSGSAYIFHKDMGGSNNWGQVAKITASDGAASDQFGKSVSISGDYVIVGAYWVDEIDSGSAYIFYKNQGGPDNWGQLAKLTSDDGVADGFGESVSISGDYAIVGAYHDDDNGDASGSAYIFHKDQGGPDNWGQMAKITANDGASGDTFGRSVSISGDNAIVGARFHGAAYIFHKDQGGPDNWGQMAKITASDGVSLWFGESVSISGDYAIVGKKDNNSIFVPDIGAAYIFYKNQGGPDNWGEVTKITASDGDENDNFGGSVSISGDYAIVGAKWDNDNGWASGSAYIFASSCQDTDNDAICGVQDNCPNTANANQEDDDNNGIGDACEPCTTPTDLSSTVDLGNQVQLTWMPPANSNACQVTIQLLGQPGTFTHNLYAPNHTSWTINDNQLNLGDSYQWNVSCSCTADYSNTSPFTIWEKFDYTCSVPDIASFYIDNCNNPVVVSWGSVPGVTVYEFHGEYNNGNRQLNRTITSPGFSVPVSVPNGFQVWVQLREQCLPGLWSDWTPLTPYIIDCNAPALPPPPSGLGNENMKEAFIVLEEIRIFPNPIKNTLNLEYYNERAENVRLEIINILGSTTYLKHLPNEPGLQKAELELGGIAQGSYLLKLQVGDRVLVKKFVKL